MKTIVTSVVVIAIGVAVQGAALAQGAGMKDMPMDKSQDMSNMKGMSEPGNVGATHNGFGVVKNVDAKAGTITFEHDPIPSIKWPAMTMTFAAADKKMLQKVKPGDKVHFQLKESPSKKGTYVVTSIKG